MDKYYRKVPPAQLEQFMRFRREHPLRNLLIDGVSFEYLTSGHSSGQPLLLMPGALSTAESAWRTVTLLEQGKYYLVVPNYPPEVDSMSGLADGVAEILAQEGIQATYVVGALVRWDAGSGFPPSPSRRGDQAGALSHLPPGQQSLP